MCVSYVIRLSKVIILLSIAGLGAVVVFGNLTDYNSNFQFVAHMMSMDSKPEYLGKAIEYRAITTTWVHHFAYISVICIEALITFFAFKGAFAMLQASKQSAEIFHQSKKYGVIALTLCCFLWFFGFQVVAGEWFGMWMSSQWNGLPDAFRLVTYMLLALIYVSLKNDE